jgi:hypothetical protein
MGDALAWKSVYQGRRFYQGGEQIEYNIDLIITLINEV